MLPIDQAGRFVDARAQSKLHAVAVSMIGSLSPDSCRAGWMPMTAALGLVSRSNAGPHGAAQLYER
jgi:hypothetical protein